MVREANFAFPAQNKACVCITSQLYDRRALDTTSALPLFNSLTHLTYLTSTSPRIREIMTMDGGLERLVRILHDFCLCPPPPENPTVLYGLTPPNSRPPKLVPTLNPRTFDKHAAYRFSLAFQCVVNIGVRGSEPIRSRVVQAGTLDVVGCILEAWLANKGFAVGPSSSATGMPRETREQRQARRTAQAEQREREHALTLARELQRQILADGSRGQENEDSRSGILFGRTEFSTIDDESMDTSTDETNQDQFSNATAGPSSNSDTEASTDNSAAVTPLGSSTPTGTVVVPSRDRSGTIIARPVWDAPVLTTPQATIRHRPHRGHRDAVNRPSPTPSNDTSRAETETEDDADGDGDISMDGGGRARRRAEANPNDSDVASASASPSPERRPHTHPRLSLGRRAVGIVSDTPGTQGLPVGNTMDLSADAHIIINDAGAVGVDGVGVEDGIVSLEPNDDFAMGAPPGAPGAIGEGATPRGLNLNMEPPRRRNTIDAPDVTPRAGVVNLPPLGTTGTTPGAGQAATPHQRNGTIRGRVPPADIANPINTGTGAAAAAAAATMGRRAGTGSHHHRDMDGPYRDEDVLLSLQLLAYLSKYPHVRQAFYKPRVTFHPASANLPGARYGIGAGQPVASGSREKERKDQQQGAGTSAGNGGTSAMLSGGSGTAAAAATTNKETHGFFKSFTSVGRGKEKERAHNSQGMAHASGSGAGGSGAGAGAGSGGPSVTTPLAPTRQTNVFSLVERFTFKPSSTETDLPNPPPRLPSEIQYWAGVIMRNACRKDDNRGGIRQCANMLCGRWEAYPREFAKCRRCRKAKYCGKECQSTAWSEGHRFWCSARDGDDDEHQTQQQAHHQQQQASTSTALALDDWDGVAVEGGAPTVVPSPMAAARGERRERHGRERNHIPLPTPTPPVIPTPEPATLRGYRPTVHPLNLNESMNVNPTVTSPTGLRVDIPGPSSRAAGPSSATHLHGQPPQSLPLPHQHHFQQQQPLSPQQQQTSPGRGLRGLDLRVRTTHQGGRNDPDFVMVEVPNQLLYESTARRRMEAVSPTGGESPSSSSSSVINSATSPMRVSDWYPTFHSPVGGAGSPLGGPEPGPSRRTRRPDVGSSYLSPTTATTATTAAAAVEDRDMILG